MRFWYFCGQIATDPTWGVKVAQKEPLFWLLLEPGSSISTRAEGCCCKTWVFIWTECRHQDMCVDAATKKSPFWLLSEPVGIAIAQVEGCHQPSEYFGIYVDR